MSFAFGAMASPSGAPTASATGPRNPFSSPAPQVNAFGALANNAFRGPSPANRATATVSPTASSSAAAASMQQSSSLAAPTAAAKPPMSKALAAAAAAAAAPKPAAVVVAAPPPAAQQQQPVAFGSAGAVANAFGSKPSVMSPTNNTSISNNTGTNSNPFGKNNAATAPAAVVFGGNNSGAPKPTSPTATSGAGGSGFATFGNMLSKTISSSSTSVVVNNANSASASSAFAAGGGSSASAFTKVAATSSSATVMTTAPTATIVSPSAAAAAITAPSSSASAFASFNSGSNAFANSSTNPFAARNSAGGGGAPPPVAVAAAAVPSADTRSVATAPPAALSSSRPQRYGGPVYAASSNNDKDNDTNNDADADGQEKQQEIEGGSEGRGSHYSDEDGDEYGDGDDEENFEDEENEFDGDGFDGNDEDFERFEDDRGENEDNNRDGDDGDAEGSSSVPITPTVTRNISFPASTPSVFGGGATITAAAVTTTAFTSSSSAASSANPFAAFKSSGGGAVVNATASNAFGNIGAASTAFSAAAPTANAFAASKTTNNAFAAVSAPPLDNVVAPVAAVIKPSVTGNAFASSANPFSAKALAASSSAVVPPITVAPTPSAAAPILGGSGSASSLSDVAARNASRFASSFAAPPATNTSAASDSTPVVTAAAPPPPSRDALLSMALGDIANRNASRFASSFTTANTNKSETNSNGNSNTQRSSAAALEASLAAYQKAPASSSAPFAAGNTMAPTTTPTSAAFSGSNIAYSNSNTTNATSTSMMMAGSKRGRIDGPLSDLAYTFEGFLYAIANKDAFAARDALEDVCFAPSCAIQSAESFESECDQLSAIFDAVSADCPRSQLPSEARAWVTLFALCADCNRLEGLLLDAPAGQGNWYQHLVAACERMNVVGSAFEEFAGAAFPLGEQPVGFVGAVPLSTIAVLIRRNRIIFDRAACIGDVSVNNTFESLCVKLSRERTHLGSLCREKHVPNVSIRSPDFFKVEAYVEMLCEQLYSDKFSSDSTSYAVQFLTDFHRFHGGATHLRILLYFRTGQSQMRKSHYEAANENFLKALALCPLSMSEPSTALGSKNNSTTNGGSQSLSPATHNTRRIIALTLFACMMAVGKVPDETLRAEFPFPAYDGLYAALEAGSEELFVATLYKYLPIYIDFHVATAIYSARSAVKACKLYKVHRLFAEREKEHAALVTAAKAEGTDPPPAPTSLSASDAAAALLFPEIVQLATEGCRMDELTDAEVALVEEAEQRRRSRSSWDLTANEVLPLLTARRMIGRTNGAGLLVASFPQFVQ